MEKESLIRLDKISKQRLDTVDLADTDNLIFRILPKDTNTTIGKRRLSYYITDKLNKKFGLDKKIFEDILLDRNMFNPNKLVAHVSSKVNDPKIIEFVEEEITAHLGDDDGKPSGPVNHNWFSNLDENRVFDQVVKWCPSFYYHKACMSDFMIDYRGTDKEQTMINNGVNPGPELISKMDPIQYKESNKNCMGCIVNTDVKPGQGIHWVAIFYDARPGKEFNTIEYFNSTGQTPKQDIKNWMKKFANLSTEQLGLPCKAVTATNISHQNSRSECGAYSAYYLMARVIGIDYKHFRKTRIPDNVVYEFRKCIFRK